MRYSHALITMAALLAGSGAAAQEQAAVQLTASVPAVLVLRTVEQAGAVSTSGRYTEIQHAAVLRVRANCRWRVVAVAADGRSALWVRAVVAGQPGAFQAIAGGSGGVAQGTPARETEIVVDYRVPAGSTVPQVTYQVQEEGAAEGGPATPQAQAQAS